MTTDLTFGTAVAPSIKSGRNIEPNPFDDKFPTKVLDTGDNEALTVTLPGTAEKNKTTITNLTGKARRAAERLKDAEGNPAPMTARVQVIEEGTNKNSKTVLYFWTVEKITRKASDASESDAAPAAAE